MKAKKSLLSVGLAALILSMGTQAATAAPSFVGYYGDWMTKPIETSGIQYLDVLNYAFFDAQADGSLALTVPNADIGANLPWNQHVSISEAVPMWYNYVNGNSEDLSGGKFVRILNIKKLYPNLKVFFVVGGWSLSTYFSDIAADPTKRQQLVNDTVNALRYFTDNAGNPVFDGIDIDWEYPAHGGNQGIHHRDTDKANYVLLLQDLRAGLDSLQQETGKTYYLTIAGMRGNKQADSGTLTDLDIQGTLKYVNWINMMAYDFSNGLVKTSFNGPLGYNSAQDNPLNNYTPSIDKAIDEYKKAGMDLTKLALGAPLYGSHWINVTAGAKNDGLFQSGTFKAVTGNENTYDSLINNVIKSSDIYSNPYVHFDTLAKATYYYNPTTKDFYSLDGKKDIEAKAQFIRDKQLGGMMFWEITGDLGNQDSLVRYAYSLLKGNPPLPPTDAGFIKICNASKASWQNFKVYQRINGGTDKLVAQGSLNVDGGSGQPSCVTYAAQYGAPSPKLYVEFENIAVQYPNFAPCDIGDLQLFKGITTNLYGVQVANDNVICKNTPFNPPANKLTVANNSAKVGAEVYVKDSSKEGHTYMIDYFGPKVTKTFDPANGTATVNVLAIEGKKDLSVTVKDWKETHTCSGKFTFDHNAQITFSISDDIKTFSCSVK